MGIHRTELENKALKNEETDPKKGTSSGDRGNVAILCPE